MKRSIIARMAILALLRNRSRSLLTMLGVVIGVAAVIITVAIGTGARTSVSDQINALGSNMIIVLPGSVNTGGVRSGFGGASSLTPADGMAIAKLPHVSAVSPAGTLRSQVVANGNNWQTTVTGVAPSYSFIKSWPLASGTFFSQSDTDSAAKVAVLGQTVIANLFPGGTNPIGSTVMIKGVPFTVTGTLTAKGQTGVGQDQDDTILVPYTSLMERLTGQTMLSTLDVTVPLNTTATVNTLGQIKATASRYNAGQRRKQCSYGTVRPRPLGMVGRLRNAITHPRMCGRRRTGGFKLYRLSQSEVATRREPRGNTV